MIPNRRVEALIFGVDIGDVVVVTGVVVVVSTETGLNVTVNAAVFDTAPTVRAAVTTDAVEAGTVQGMETHPLEDVVNETDDHPSRKVPGCFFGKPEPVTVTTVPTGPLDGLSVTDVDGAALAAAAPNPPLRAALKTTMTTAITIDRTRFLRATVPPNGCDNLQPPLPISDAGPAAICGCEFTVTDLRGVSRCAPHYRAVTNGLAVVV